MRAIIIAGGLATRLGDLTKANPKCLLPLGGKPLLSHQLDLLINAGFQDIFIISGHLAGPIHTFIDSNPRYKSVKIIQDLWPAGSGGCLRFLPDYNSFLLILFGDIAIRMNLNDLLDFHQKMNGIGTIVLQHNDHPNESDLIEINEVKECINIYCKPHSITMNKNLCMGAGVFMMESSMIEYISGKNSLDLVHDIFAPAIQNKKGIYGYYTSEYLDDIGTPTRYARINREWNKEKVYDTNC